MPVGGMMTLYMAADKHRVAPPSKEEGVSPIEGVPLLSALLRSAPV
jgi:hypothetical protein